MYYERLHADGAISIPSQRGNRDAYFNPEPLKRIYDDLVTDAGVDVLLATRVIAIKREGGHLTHAVCQGKSGLFAVAARAFVDATGDADLCAWAGAPFDKGNGSLRVMPGCFITGQAAGTAAALCAAETWTTRELPIAALHAALLDLGALPAERDRRRLARRSVDFKEKAPAR